jgi:hypothetical protein
LGKLGFGWWWAVEVGNSPWFQIIYGGRGPSDELKHYALALHDMVFHVIASGVAVERLDDVPEAYLRQAVNSVSSEFKGTVNHISTF